jgi:amino acid permease
METRIGPLTVILAIIGLICIVVAIIYFTVSANSLPSFIPGHAKSHLHHNRRGIAALVVGILFLIGAGASALFSREEV